MTNFIGRLIFIFGMALMFTPYLSGSDYMGALDGWINNGLDNFIQIFDLFETIDYNIDERFLYVVLMTFRDIVGDSALTVMFVGRIMATRG